MILLRTLNSWSWAQRAFSPTELIEIYKDQGGNSRRREQGVWGQRRGAARGHSCPLPLHWCGELRAQESHGFTVTPQRFGGYPVVALTDLDYEEDICLISDHVEQVQELLIRVEAKCSGVSLRLNAKKTEVISFNIPQAIHLSEQQEAMLWKTSATSSGVPWSILRNGTLRWERQRHGGPFTTGKRLEIQSSSTHLNHSLPSHCQICALLRLWVMDPEAHSTEIFGCMLHMSAAYSTEQWPESANSQWAPCMVGYRGWVTKWPPEGGKSWATATDTRNFQRASWCSGNCHTFTNWEDALCLHMWTYQGRTPGWRALQTWNVVWRTGGVGFFNGTPDNERPNDEFNPSWLFDGIWTHCMSSHRLSYQTMRRHAHQILSHFK